MIQPIEELRILSQRKIGTNSGQSLIERHCKNIGIFWENPYGSELLPILIILLVFDMPEPFIFDEIAPGAAAEDLAIIFGLFRGWRGLIEAQVRGKFLIPEKTKTCAVEGIGAGFRDDVDCTARCQIGAHIE